MGLFDKFKKKNNGLTIEEIISNDYEQEYFEECKYIWKNYVPSRGWANGLQGELLREIEKIRCEAQDNGNINWDDDYSYFCDFISERLCEQPIFTATEKAAYVRDNLYDIICDKIGKLYKENPYLIPYERNNNIKR